MKNIKKGLLYLVPYVVISVVWILINKGWERKNFQTGLNLILLAIGWWILIMIFAGIFKTKIENSEKFSEGCLFNLFFWITILIFGLGIFGLILIGVE